MADLDDFTALKIDVGCMKSNFNAYLERQDDQSKRLHADLSRVVSRLDGVVTAINVDHASIKEELLSAVNRQYVDSETFTTYRINAEREAITKINTAKTELIRTLTFIGTSILSVVSFCGWLYIQSQKMGVQP